MSHVPTVEGLWHPTGAQWQASERNTAAGCDQISTVRTLMRKIAVFTILCVWFNRRARHEEPVSYAGR
jgi:hypothetical protein